MSQRRPAVRTPGCPDRAPVLIGIAALLSMLVGACGANDAVDAPASGPRGLDAGVDNTLLLTPSSDYWTAWAGRMLRTAQAGGETPAAEPRRSLRLEFDGATVRSGHAPGESPAVCSESARVAGTRISASARDGMRKALEGLLAPAGIVLTDDAGNDAETAVIHVGGRYADLGCAPAPDERTVLAATVADDGDFNGPDTGFVFDNGDPELNRLHRLAAEVATAMFDPGRAAAARQEREALPESALSGLDELNSLAKLMWQIDTSGISLTALRPALDGLIPGGSADIHGIERVLAATVGAAQATGAQTGGGATPQTGTVTDKITQAVSQVDPTTVATVATMAGHPEIGAAIMILGPLIGMGPGQPAGSTPASPGTPATSPAPGAVAPPPQVTLPDYAAYLKLPKFAGRAAWLGSFRGHLAYVNSHYTGNTQVSLQALLILAYSRSLQVMGG